MSLPTKMSPHPLPLQNHFLFSPRRPSAQNPQAEPLIKYQKATQSHKRHTKSKQKSNSNTTAHKSPKQTPQKDNPKQSIKPHQLENIPPRQPFKSNKHPPKSHSETILPKTQGRFLSNASAFHSKRRRVCFQTQRRFT